MNEDIALGSEKVKNQNRVLQQILFMPLLPLLPLMRVAYELVPRVQRPTGGQEVKKREFGPARIREPVRIRIT